MSEEDLYQFQKEITAFQSEIDYYIEDILSEIDRKEKREYIRSLAFSSSDIFPKRNYKPMLTFPFITKQLYLSHSNGELLSELMSFTLTFIEYYDIVDDLIDGDVIDSYKKNVLIGKELLQSLLVQQLTRLEDSVIDYYCRNIMPMWGGDMEELRSKPSRKRYLEIVGKQANIFSTIAGIVSIISESGEFGLEKAEKFGDVYFKFDQFILDGEQYKAGDPDPWNAWNLLPEEEVRELISGWQETLEILVTDLPEKRAQLLRPLIAIDIESWNPS
ncbi:hypothetical protein [Haloterrigena salifodinae]|uniref:hypothetical protein n=1 Tax=Haloterrigena salifodinae TaxID=2675099 RepID=UPI001B85F063|nr:hypothetical protein [Haloterrigena salifodinae]